MTPLTLLLYSGSVIAAFLLIWAADGTPSWLSLPAVLMWPVVWPVMLLFALFKYFKNS